MCRKAFAKNSLHSSVLECTVHISCIHEREQNPFNVYRPHALNISPLMLKLHMQLTSILYSEQPEESAQVVETPSPFS